jgi:hypothetical protein
VLTKTRTYFGCGVGQAVEGGALSWAGINTSFIAQQSVAKAYLSWACRPGQ